MSLYTAIGSAISGLNASQAGLDLVSRNIANSGTPGYTRKTQVVQNNIAGGEGIGVQLLAATRNVDRFLQQQIRTEGAATARLNVYTTFLGRIDTMFGTPESNSSIAGSVTALETRLQALATTPDDPAARQTFLNAASNLASQLNSMTKQIQGMRQEAEQNISAAVSQANTLLKSVADLNNQIAQRQASSLSVADLQDKRDAAINSLSQLMDLKALERDDGTVALFTGGGQLLLDKQAVQLTFDAHLNLDAVSSYNIDASKRTVGTVTLQNGTTSVDLIASGAFRSGSIAGYLEMRDKVLPQAQAQLDELASQLALSLSQETVAGTAASSGPATGYSIDTSTLLSGNTINLTYTDTPAGTKHNVTIVKVMDPSALPLSNMATSDPNDVVIGINFNQPMAGVVADIQAALPASVAVSNPGGTTLSFLDDGAAGTSDVNVVSATVTPASLADAGTGLPLFVDGTAQRPYSGSFDNPPQITGFAGRIAVNKAVLADDTSLVIYQTSPQTLIGDDTRPNDLLRRLTDGSRLYSASTGIGSATTPFAGSLDSFARRIVSFQSSQAANASSDAQAQQIVSNTLEDKFNSDTGVNIDTEMSNLIMLQNTYAANARVITTIQNLFQVLMSIGK
ncbi:MAG: flagellar hook-associated protein FlgK [Parvibaculum sp.]|uniref:flagellar hook-associated protein FlgK n=1 Tax=Parvibaculum sp. TaxID=2024848 RepID=UPI003C709324